MRRLIEMGADVFVHDPYVAHWWEFEAQEDYPGARKGRSRFFRNQKKLKDLRMEPDLWSALEGADVVIFAVRHKQFKGLNPDRVISAAGGPIAGDRLLRHARRPDHRPVLRTRVRGQGVGTRPH